MAKRTTSVEQRIATRVPIRVRVEYETLEDFLDDYSSNLSLGGMFVQTGQPLAIGTRFRLRFRLPDREKAIETYAVVRWVHDDDTPSAEGRGMGIQFDDLSPKDQKSIKNWLMAADS